jgi:hypothetical protein
MAVSLKENNMFFITDKTPRPQLVIFNSACQAPIDVEQKMQIIPTVSFRRNKICALCEK